MYNILLYMIIIIMDNNVLNISQDSFIRMSVYVCLVFQLLRKI